MCYELKTSYGGTEAVIDDNCGISKFYAIARTLADDLQVKFLNQVDDAETLDWDFQYRGQFLTLHYNMFNGVSIYPQQLKSTSRDNIAVLEVAHFLEHRVY
ncbi:MAG: hypothetical protein IPI66_00485 [Chitinophagaceae bacterium]|nr:hypothetical protein [Chitinophagaceae bacterium]MBL0054691.1 hypothetical protein [Chitinophagaceae bacterium]